MAENHKMVIYDLMGQDKQSCFASVLAEIYKGEIFTPKNLKTFPDQSILLLISIRGEVSEDACTPLIKNMIGKGKKYPHGIVLISFDNPVKKRQGSLNLLTALIPTRYMNAPFKLHELDWHIDSIIKMLEGPKRMEAAIEIMKQNNTSFKNLTKNQDRNEVYNAYERIYKQVGLKSRRLKLLHDIHSNVLIDKTDGERPIEKTWDVLHGFIERDNKDKKFNLYTKFTLVQKRV